MVRKCVLGRVLFDLMTLKFAVNIECNVYEIQLKMDFMQSFVKTDGFVTLWSVRTETLLMNRMLFYSLFVCFSLSAGKFSRNGSAWTPTGDR